MTVRRSMSRELPASARRLQEEVCRANRELQDLGLVLATFGNASAILRDEGLVAIKASGVPYESLSPQHMVLVDLQGRVVEGSFNPSSETATHLALYRAFAHIGAVAHTHSPWATAWAQALKPLPCLGTTHADVFHGEVPCTAAPTDEEIARDYEEQTAARIVAVFRDRDYLAVPGVLVASHGPFTWGRSAREAVYHSLVLERVAHMGLLSLALNPGLEGVSQRLLDKHFQRKHGPQATYGQREKGIPDT